MLSLLLINKLLYRHGKLVSKRNQILIRLFTIYEIILVAALGALSLIQWLSTGSLQASGVISAFVVFQTAVAVLMAYSFWKYRNANKQ